MDQQFVVLVNENDEAAGFMEKMEAHVKGVLHRAFSIFIFNSKGQMLLQQRALNKYHSGGLWSNACCSHPSPGEEIQTAAQRRLNEELGIRVPLEKIFDFVYRAEFENGLTEYEFDHVFAAEYDGALQINPQEVNDCTYKSLPEIKDELQHYPEKYTPWFHIAFPKVENWLSTRN